MAELYLSSNSIWSDIPKQLVEDQVVRPDSMWMRNLILF